MLATARDWGILVLSVEAFVVLLGSLLAGYYVNRGLRSLVGATRPFLRQVGTYVAAVTKGAKSASMWVAAPFLWLCGTVEGVRVTVDVLSRYLRRGR